MAYFSLWRQAQSEMWGPAQKPLLPALGTSSRVSVKGFLVPTLELPQSKYSQAESSNFEMRVSARVRSDREGFDLVSSCLPFDCTPPTLMCRCREVLIV